MDIPERDWAWPEENADISREGAWEERVWAGPVSVYTGHSVHVSNDERTDRPVPPTMLPSEEKPDPWEKMVRAVRAGRP